MLLLLPCSIINNWFSRAPRSTKLRHSCVRNPQLAATNRAPAEAAKNSKNAASRAEGGLIDGSVFVHRPGDARIPHEQAVIRQTQVFKIIDHDFFRRSENSDGRHIQLSQVLAYVSTSAEVPSFNRVPIGPRFAANRGALVSHCDSFHARAGDCVTALISLHHIGLGMH